MSATRILLVDDNDQDRAITARELQRQFPECEVTSVSTQREFARALKNKPFHLAITDLQLPWSDGITLFRRIRTQDPSCPVILYTGSSGSEVMARALEAGVDDFVVKSIDHLPQLIMAARMALDRRNEQQAAGKAETRFQFLFQTLPIGLLFIDPGGNLLDVNPRMVSMLGYSDRESLLSLKRVGFFENGEIEKDFHRRLRESPVLKGYETRLRRRDGSLLWCSFFAHPVAGDDGKTQYYEAVVEDIQARKEAELAHSEKELEIKRVSDSLRAILEAAPNPILGIDSQGRIGFVWNQAAEALLGIPRENAFGRSLLELIPELAEHLKTPLAGADKTSAVRRLTVSCRLPGRPALHLNASVSPLRPVSGAQAGQILVLTDVTARKDAEDTLRLNEARLELITNSVSDMLMLLSVEGEETFRVISVNRAVTENTGRSAESLVGKTLQDFLGESVIRWNAEKFREVVQSGRPLDYVLSTRPLGRPRICMEVRLNPIADRDGLPGHILVVARNITDRIQNERKTRHTLHALRESERRYRALAEAAPDMVFILDRDLTVEYVNLFSSRMFNRPVSEIVGRSMRELFPPAIARRQAEFIGQVFDSGESVYSENPSWIGSREIWMGTWLVPMRDPNGRIYSVLGVARDISERVLSEKALRESEEQYRSLVQTSPDAITLHGPYGALTFANQRALEMLGCASMEDLRGTTLPDLAHPDERRQAEAQLQVLMQSGSLRNAELSLRRKDGAAAPMEINASCIRDLDGRMKGITCILRDITARRTRERALIDSEARFRAMFEKTAVGIILIGLDKRLITGNPAICEMLETTRDELLERSPEELVHPEDLAAAEALIEEVLGNRRDHYQQEIRLRTNTGKPIWCRLTVSAVTDFRNELQFVIAMAEDISKEREAEQASRQASEALRRYTDRLETLHAIDRAILEARTPEDIARAALERIHRLLPIQRGSLILFDFERGTAEALESPAGADGGSGNRRFIPLAEFTQEISKLKAGELVAVDDLLAEESPSATERLLLAQGLRAYLSIPLRSRGELIGALVITSGISGAFTREHAEIAKEVADSVTVAIQQSRLLRQVRRHTFELEAAAALNRDLRLISERAGMPQIVIRHLQKGLDCDFAALLIADPSRGRLAVEKTSEAHSRLEGVSIPLKDSLSGEAVEAGTPLRWNAAEFDAGKPECAEWMSGLQTAACAPMTSRGSLIGVLWAGRTPHGGAGGFHGEDLRLMGTIAELAGNTLHRAELHEQTEQRLRRLSALRAVDMAISASIDLRVTLSVLLDQVTSQLQVDAAAIRLLNPHSQTLTYLAGRGVQSTVIPQTPVLLGQGYAGTAALERRVVSVSLPFETENTYMRLLLESDDRFVSYFVAPLLAKGRIKGVLELFHRRAFQPDEEWIEYLEAMATQAAIAIDNASLFEDVEKTNTELIAAYDATIEGWSRALELRDREPRGHTLRVTDVTIRLGRIMGMPEEELVHVRRGALLHDIGKMAISDTLLLKAGPLADEEAAVMRRHPAFAHELLSPIQYLRPALAIPYCHHERWDGSGYPRGLEKEQIPLAARVFAVVDVWDTLRSDRPYSAAWPEEKVRRFLRDQSGKQFDPAVVEAFFTIIDEEIRDRE
ncbi:MAG: PAS domain S-box protein [Anaerolineales bacterium]|nr:PAS domain S-box protein [Anaerolineales bacterium]